MLLSIFFKAAIKRGAVSVREPWDETDEGGTVTFATVQTVSEFVALLSTGGGYGFLPTFK